MECGHLADTRVKRSHRRETALVIGAKGRCVIKVEYFFMMPDLESSGTIRVKRKGEQITNETAQVVIADLAEEKDRPDFMEIKGLMRNAYIVSTRLKELLMIYADHMKADPFILVDPENEKQENYWKIALDELKDLSGKKVDITERMEESVWEYDQFQGKHICCIKRGDRQYWIASLHFAENFMRKNMFGVKWKRVKRSKENE